MIRKQYEQKIIMTDGFFNCLLLSYNDILLFLNFREWAKHLYQQLLAEMGKRFQLEPEFFYHRSVK